MTPERWKEIGAIVDGALELPSDRRAAFITRACTNAELRIEVERLLEACERSDGYLDEPARGIVAPMVEVDAGPPVRHDAGMLPRLRTGLAGRYSIERELGHGGMAVVYLAHDVRHARAVALKVLRPDLAAALGAQRFLREIETLARLAHPHILPMLDSGEVDGLPYYVMPYVEGESLRARIDRERQLPVEEAIRIAGEVAGALDYAHRHNVLHRDLKPENILLADGQAVVADFGIARALSQAAERAGDSAMAETLTATGLSLGTPAYMSPEQAAGDRTIDGRSDVYALGCLLFELLAGQAPFTGPTAESIVRQHMLMAPPALAALRAGVPAPVLNAVNRALAKAPADRFGTMGAFARALSSSTPQTRAGRATHERRRGRVRRLRWVLVLFVLASIMAWGAWRLRAVLFSAQDGEAPLVEHARRMHIDPAPELNPVTFPDDRFVASARTRHVIARTGTG